LERKNLGLRSLKIRKKLQSENIKETYIYYKKSLLEITALLS